MLNPLAHDFAPNAPASPNSVKKKELQSLPSHDFRKPKQKDNVHVKKTPLAESKKTATIAGDPSAIKSHSKKPQNHKPSLEILPESKDSQANSLPFVKKQQRDPKAKTDHSSFKSKPDYGKQKSRRKSTQIDSFSIDTQFSQASKFISIEAAIDPIHRKEPAKSEASGSSGGVRRTSSGTTDIQFEHGYERYIEWIDRSLRIFDTVTLVGMDNAVVDVVSLVTILQDRKVGVHDDLETFSMNNGNGRVTSGIQVKLHLFY